MNIITEVKAPEVCMSEKLYDIILADPPWHFQNWKGEPGEMKARSTDGRAAQNHYPTMSSEQIKGLKIPASPNSVLLLWACWPLLPQALETIEAWNFEYKTLAWVWIKSNPSGFGHRMGLGFWTRSNSEPCLLATRGKGIPRQNKDVLSLIYSPIRRHSQKPSEQYEKIDRLFGPTVPRLEMFARNRQPGWDTWGNEIDNDVIIDGFRKE